jgi:hypothetical protein
MQMSKRILFVGFAVSLFFSAGVVLAEEQATALTFKEGDTWQFNISRKGQVGSSTEQNEGMYELSFKQGAAKLYELSGSQKNEIPIQPQGPSQGLLRLVGKSDLRPDLKFPLSAGQKWTYELVTRPPGSKFDQRRSAEVTVAGMEQVTTPAGGFKAYKLVGSESWSVGSLLGERDSSTTTYFYSPETRSIVKSSSLSYKNPGTIETELIKFTPLARTFFNPVLQS